MSVLPTTTNPPVTPSPRHPVTLARARVVLVRPQTAANLGAVARVMRNLGLSVITDMCLPDALEPVKLEDVIAVANAAEKKLRVLVRRVVQEFSTT